MQKGKEPGEIVMEWKEMDKKRRGILLTVMLLTPVTAFYLMQLIMGTKFVDV